MRALRRSSIRVACEPFRAIAAHKRTYRTRTWTYGRYPSIVPSAGPLAAPPAPRPSPPIQVLLLSISLPLAARHTDTPRVRRPASS